MIPFRDESKRFQTRDSPLTKSLRESSAARATYSCFISVGCFVLVRIVYLYLLDPGVRQSDWDFLKRCMSDFHHFVFGWLTLLSIFTIIGCSATKVRVTISMPALIYFPIVFSYLTGSFVFAVLHNLSTKLHVSMALALSIEHVRMVMKMISFVVENERKLSGLPIDCHSNQTKPEPPTFKSFLYFMIAPTLLYRDKYPRSESPFKYRSFVTWSLQCFVTAVVGLHLANQVGNPSAKYVGLVPITAGVFMDLLSWSFVGGTFTYIITIGYVYLHCYCNASAEVLRFGDRRFYGNWWSAPNLCMGFGWWNYVLNSWLVEYAHKPVIHWTGSRPVAGAVVFAVSAFLHDYVMSAALGFMFTMWTIAGFFLIPGFLLWVRARPRTASLYRVTPVPTTDENGERGQPLNLCFFLTLFTIVTVLAFLTAGEYFAHQNCRPNGETWYWKVLPRFFTCLMLHMDK